MFRFAFILLLLLIAQAGLTAQNIKYVTSISVESATGGKYSSPDQKIGGTVYDNGTLVYVGLGGLNAESHPRFLGNQDDWGKMLFIDSRSGSKCTMQVPMAEVCDELPSILNGLQCSFTANSRGKIINSLHPKPRRIDRKAGLAMAEIAFENKEKNFRDPDRWQVVFVTFEIESGDIEEIEKADGNYSNMETRSFVNQGDGDFYRFYDGDYNVYTYKWKSGNLNEIKSCRGFFKRENRSRMFYSQEAELYYMHGYSEKGEPVEKLYVCDPASGKKSVHPSTHTAYGSYINKNGIVTIYSSQMAGYYQMNLKASNLARKTGSFALGDDMKFSGKYFYVLDDGSGNIEARDPATLRRVKLWNLLRLRPGLKQYSIYPNIGISGGPLTLVIGEGSVEKIKEYHIFNIED